MDISELYGNLPGTDLSEEIDNLKNQNNLLHEHIQSLESDIEKLCSKITEMKRVQTNLTKNISELYKTAKAEIDRKDRMINDLRSKLEESEAQRNFFSVSLKRQKEFGATDRHLQKQHIHQNISWTNKNINRKPGNSSSLQRGQSENQPYLREQQYQYKNMDCRDRFHLAKRMEPESLDVDKRRSLVRQSIKEIVPTKTVSRHQIDERRIKESTGKVDVKLLNPVEKLKAELPNSDFALDRQPNKVGVNRSDKMRNDNSVNLVEPVKPDIRSIEENRLNLSGESKGIKHTEISSIVKSNESALNKKHQQSSNSKRIEEVALSLLKLHETPRSEKDVCSSVVFFNNATKAEQNEKSFTEGANKTILASDKSNAKGESPIKGLILNEVLRKNEKQVIDKEKTFNSQESMEVDDKMCEEKIENKDYEKNCRKTSHKALRSIPQKDRSSTGIQSLVKEENDVEVVSLEKQVFPSKKNISSSKKKVESPKLESTTPKKVLAGVEIPCTRKVDETGVTTASQQKVITSLKEELNTSPNKELAPSHACQKQPSQDLKEELPLTLLNANPKNIVSQSLIRASSCGSKTNSSPLRKRRRVIFSMID